MDKKTKQIIKLKNDLSQLGREVVRRKHTLNQRYRFQTYIRRDMRAGRAIGAEDKSQYEFNKLLIKEWQKELKELTIRYKETNRYYSFLTSNRPYQEVIRDAGCLNDERVLK